MNQLQNVTVPQFAACLKIGRVQGLGQRVAIGRHRLYPCTCIMLHVASCTQSQTLDAVVKGIDVSPCDRAASTANQDDVLG